METKYLVVLVKEVRNVSKAMGIYGNQYFPRRFVYKVDAIKCQERANQQGIKTQIK